MRLAKRADVLRSGTIAGWLLLGAAALELVGREVARRSVFGALGISLSAGAVILIAAVGAVAAGLPGRTTIGGRRAANFTGPLFALLFVMGVALQLQLGRHSKYGSHARRKRPIALM